MFQRQTRNAFPARNILVLAALVLACLLYVLRSMKEKPTPPATPETPAVQADSVK
ncbi:MAG: hypothetical protein LCH81_08110 [Bacteroidetes bacterium]|nr:hypothetical protein [Bacteroidota bacterium]